MKPRRETWLLLVSLVTLALAATLKHPERDGDRQQGRSDYVTHKARAALNHGQLLLPRIGTVVDCSDQDLWRLTAAVIIAENYFRSAFQRSAEFALIDSPFSSRHRETVSLGIAQMQPRAARLALAELGHDSRIDTDAIVELLRDDEASFLLAYGYLSHLTRTGAYGDEPRGRLLSAAADYNGHTGSFFSRLYADVVMAIYDSGPMRSYLAANDGACTPF